MITVIDSGYCSSDPDSVGVDEYEWLYCIVINQSYSNYDYMGAYISWNISQYLLS
jgi:hypothetical protein